MCTRTPSIAHVVCLRCSRAVIRKGTLFFRQRTSVAGHMFQVLDEHGSVLLGSSILMGSDVFEASAEGNIAIPFAERAQNRDILLCHVRLPCAHLESFVATHAVLWIGYCPLHVRTLTPDLGQCCSACFIPAAS